MLTKIVLFVLGTTALVVISRKSLLRARSLGFYRDLCTAQARLEAGRRVIETAFGPMEYCESGAGQPVLVSSFLAGQIVPAR